LNKKLETLVSELKLEFQTLLPGAWRPGQEKSLASPCSNLRSFGSKCAVLKKVLVTLLALCGAPRSHSVPHSDSAPGNCVPLSPLVTPITASYFDVENTRQSIKSVVVWSASSSFVSWLHSIFQKRKRKCESYFTTNRDV